MICGFVMKYADILLTPYQHIHGRTATILFMVCSVLLVYFLLVFFVACASFYTLYYCSCINFGERFNIVAFSIATTNVVHHSIKHIITIVGIRFILL